jgi:hypothetical protein
MVGVSGQCRAETRSERSFKMDKVNEMAEAVAKQGELEEKLPETRGEPKKVETPVVEPTKKEPDQQESYLGKKDDEDEVRQNYVPVSALQKERQKRQEERQRREVAEQKLADLQAEPETSLDLSALDADPEGLINNQTASKLIKQAAQAGAKSAVSQIEKRIQTEQQETIANQQRTAIVQSEQKAREKFKDFDAVVKAAIDEGGFTPEEVDSIRRSANPGVVLYRKAKETLSTLGINVQQKLSENPPEPTPEGDEDIYAEVFGKKPG